MELDGSHEYAYQSGQNRAIDKQITLLLGLALPQRIIAALGQHGAEVRFCGGVVRDILMGQLKWPTPDIDMASPMPPAEAARILKADNLKVIPTGIDHGTITVMMPTDPDLKVELTTLRVDHNPDGRHAEVGFIEDWNTDASRRDFTFNSFYMTASGDIIDPFGGRDDLEAGLVRFIGNPKDRITEDVLRIFRYFRFYARFGHSAIEPETATALIDAAPLISGLSGERIATELKKTLSYQSLETFALMEEMGIWQALTGDRLCLEDYAALLDLGIDDDAILGLAALTPAGNCDGLAARLKLSKKDTDKLKRISTLLGEDQMTVLLSPDYKQECWRLCRRHDWSLADIAGAMIITSIRAGKHYAALKHITVDHIRDQVRMIRLAEWPDMPVNGDDIRAHGLVEGRQIGTLLKQLEDIWVTEGFVPNRRTLLTYLAEWLAKD